MNNNFKKCIWLSFVNVWLIFLFINSTCGAKELTITILHTNDLHAHELTYIDHDKQIGGFAKIGYLIHQYKNKTQNCLAIDAGDIFQGSPLYTYYHGECEVKCLNAMGYDIYTIGNHEFDDGPINLAKQLSQAKFTIINCNLDFSQYKEFANLVKPYIVKEIDGQKIAFIGAITPDIGQVSLTLQNVKVTATGKDWYEPIKQMAVNLKENGIDKIVLVTHCGVEADKELAQKIPCVDAIIGGHSHTKLAKPIIIPHNDGSNTAIVQTGCYGRYLGVLTLPFNNDGQIIVPKVKDELIPITASIPEDKTVLSIINEKEQPIAKIINKVIGQSDVYLSKLTSRTLHDFALDDVICDAIYEAGSKYGATISFQNRGGTRTGIEKGDITIGSVQSMLPFKNHLVVASITGKSLFNIMETSLTKLPSARFLDVYGLKVIYAPENEVLHRVKYLLYLNPKTNNYEPVKEDNYYRIVLNSYTFNGGEGYDFGEFKDKIDLPTLLSDAFTAYVLKHVNIGYPQTNRIIPVYDFAKLTETNKNKQKISITNASNFDSGYLLEGKSIGISNLKNHLTFPLTDFKVIKKFNLSDSDEYNFDYALNKHNYYCIVLKNSAKKNSIASFPLLFETSK